MQTTVINVQFPASLSCLAAVCAVTWGRGCRRLHCGGHVDAQLPLSFHYWILKLGLLVDVAAQIKITTWDENNLLLNNPSLCTGDSFTHTSYYFNSFIHLYRMTPRRPRCQVMFLFLSSPVFLPFSLADTARPHCWYWSLSVMQTCDLTMRAGCHVTYIYIYIYMLGRQHVTQHRRVL